LLIEVHFLYSFIYILLIEVHFLYSFIYILLIEVHFFLVLCISRQ
jgi:hypothetical protein